MGTYVGFSIALVAVVVSVLQYEANRTKLKYDLFERRRSVYERVEEYYNKRSQPEPAANDDDFARIEEFKAIARLVEQLFDATAYDHARKLLGCLEEINNFRQQERRLTSEIEKFRDNTSSERYTQLQHEIMMIPYGSRWPAQGSYHYYTFLMDEMARQMKIVEPPSILEMPGRIAAYLGTLYGRIRSWALYHPVADRVRGSWREGRLRELAHWWIDRAR